MKNGVHVTPPSLSALLTKVETRVFQNMNCVKIGRITAFDAVKRTAKVEVMFRRLLADGKTIQDFPLLQDCPVFTLQGGGSALTVPIAAGDECLVLFSDNNIDAWYEAGQPALPYDGRRHDISDGIAIVGLNSLAKPISPAVTANEVALTYGGAKISEKNGKIALSNAAADFITAMDLFLTGLNPTTLAAQAATLKTTLDLLFYKGI